jgi:hypothetical protein
MGERSCREQANQRAGDPAGFCWRLVAQDVCVSVQVLRAVRLLFLCCLRVNKKALGSGAGPRRGLFGGPGAWLEGGPVWRTYLPYFGKLRLGLDLLASSHRAF